MRELLCRSASLTRLELGSSLAWMLRCDYGRGGPWSWGYTCWILVGGGDWGVDVLRAYQTNVAVTKALPAHCCSVSPALVITSPLPELPTNSPLEKLRISYKTKATTAKRDWHIYPNCVHVSLHVLTTTLLPLKDLARYL